MNNPTYVNPYAEGFLFVSWSSYILPLFLNWNYVMLTNLSSLYWKLWQKFGQYDKHSITVLGSDCQLITKIAPFIIIDSYTL